MAKLLKYFKLIRPLNLFILGGTLYIIHSFLITSFLAEFGILASANFFAFLIPVILISAGGYIINDYFDIGIDAINKPESQIINKTILAKTTKIAYVIIVVFGLVSAIYFSFLANSKLLFAIYLTSILLLFFYSKNLKSKPLVGNLTIAFLATLVLVIPFISEFSGISFLKEVSYSRYSDLLFWMGFISIFSFLTTLSREIVKDVEDMDGDSKKGCRTIPIVLGISNTKTILSWISSLTFFLLFFGILLKVTTLKLAFIISITILSFIPLLAQAYYISVASEKKQFTKASFWLKIAMIGGILSFTFI